MSQSDLAADGRAFCECEPALDDRPITQGDVVRFHNTDDPWECLGVIVTADCDIARNKHAGRLTYVPILTAHAYLGIFWMPRRLTAIADQLGERLVSKIRKVQATNFPEFTTPLSADRALRWTVERSPGGIAEALRLDHGQDREAFLKLAHAYVAVVAAIDSSFHTQTGALCDALCVLGRPSDHEVARRRIEADLESYLANLPGDTLFLSRIDPGHAEGYVCYLRVLRDIPDTDIATRPRDTAQGARASRIAHLQSPYLYRLTQQLADVFAAIGLPEEYEESRSRVAKMLLHDRVAKQPDQGAE